MAELASKSKLDWSRVSKILFFVFTACLLQGSTFSHVTSFFNKYALEEKDLSSTQYGIVMGAYAFAVMTMTPLCAAVLRTRKFSDKAILFTGLTVDSCFCLIMSSVCLIGGGILFFLASLILRLCAACGCAIGFFMAYVIIGVETPEINHIIIPLLETCYGVAVVIGPAISGILYDIGGFPVPFLVIGGSLLTLAIVGIFAFPSSLPRNDEDGDENEMKLSSAWQFPIVVNVLCSLNTFALISFNEATLALRLYNKFGMTAGESGAVFLFVGGFYALSGLASGFMSKKVSEPRYFTALGQFTLVVAMILQAPLLNFEQTTTHVYIAQIMLGLGSGPAYVCSYLQSLRYLGDGKETKETYAVLSAIFTPVTALGGTIGPLVGGILLDFFSYEQVVLVYTTLSALSFITLVITIRLTQKSKPRSSATAVAAIT
ncbi:MFS-type transporter SLC18B1 [Galendromus occidentalis]|uniref:MFS-type transporter SLC18B1 n=1 Tax=Galendromus occidentalis TaxID=34638 RepID=A0AAJ6VVU8_9ACAR|nr:MFS-type transporter SLC18B1 [Galendromus occidentalis]